MNVERLRQVRDHLETLPPQQFNMSDWIFHSNLVGYDKDGRPLKEASCGTSACIAGWACILNPIEAEREHGGQKVQVAIVGGVWECEERARELLGLDEHTAKALFTPHNVFGQGVSDLHEIDLPWAIRCLDHLIATGRVDWHKTRDAV
jgi:hypothetical protein